MTFALLLLHAICGAAPVAAPDAAEKAFQSAMTSQTELKADSKKMALRHHWENAAKKMIAVAQKYPKSSRAKQALKEAASLYEQLARRSGDKRDVESARRLKDQAAAIEPTAIVADVKNKGSDAKTKSASAPSRNAATPKANAPITAAPGKSSRERPRVAAKLAMGASRPTRPPQRLSSGTDESDFGARSVKRMADAFREFELPSSGDEGASEEADAVIEHEGPHLPSVEELAEKLRDVRVGSQQAKAMRVAVTDQEMTLSEQLGLKVKRVIIDAGHGGHDTGAIGKSGHREKDIALKIALKLAHRLRKAGLEVLMTRDDDTFIRLDERTAFANRRRGDLFISIHCNSAVGNKLSGVETYTLNTSSDRYSVRLAARENAHSERGVGDLQLILADLATKANTEESTRLANRVQREMVAGLKPLNPSVRDLGHKEALFFVLLGAKMPAILVETSFLSNPTEEKLLATDAYQDDAAASIARGVTRFLDERSKVARVE